MYTGVLEQALVAPCSHPVLPQLLRSPTMDATEQNQSNASQINKMAMKWALTVAFGFA